jgi:hypothetical protein
MISTTFLFVTCAFLSVPVIGQSKMQNPQTQNVQVVNSAGQPVPTAAQGTTNVAGTVGLAAGSTVNVGNTPNVNVANTPSVSVANTPTVNLQAGATINVTNPLDSQNSPTPLAVLEGTQPYEDSCTMSFSTYAFSECSFQQVPPGKRLMIQQFDAGATLEVGVKPSVITFNAQHSGTNPHYFPATEMGSASYYDAFATHQETRMYVQGGNTPVCTVYLNGGSNNYYHCTFSGLLQ